MEVKSFCIFPAHFMMSPPSNLLVSTWHLITSPTEMVDAPQLPECLCVMSSLMLLTCFRSVTNHFVNTLQVLLIESDRLGRTLIATPAINGFHSFKKIDRTIAKS